MKKKQIPVGYKQVELSTLLQAEHCLIKLKDYTQLITFQLETVKGGYCHLKPIAPIHLVGEMRNRMYRPTYKVLVKMEELSNQSSLF